jgi:hypothetical protein
MSPPECGARRYSSAGSVGKVLAIDARGSYLDSVTDARGHLDNDVRVIQLEVGLRFNCRSTEPVSPHIGGGAAYYSVEFSGFGGNVGLAWRF